MLSNRNDSLRLLYYRLISNQSARDKEGGDEEEECQEEEGEEVVEEEECVDEVEGAVVS